MKITLLQIIRFTRKAEEIAQMSDKHEHVDIGYIFVDFIKGHYTFDEAMTELEFHRQSCEEST